MVKHVPRAMANIDITIERKKALLHIISETGHSQREVVCQGIDMYLQREEKRINSMAAKKSKKKQKT